jgi:hypothetical protein
METIILPVDTMFSLPTRENIILYKSDFETDKYNFIFICIECKTEYNNLFDARYCLHPKFYNIKSKL